MSSFEELGLSPALVEALAAEGIEVPTPLQEQVVPALKRGTSVVLRGSAGSGVLAAYGSAILGRIEPAGSEPRALVLTGTRTEADRLASSLARFASATGHRVGALESAWAFPERAHVLFASAADLDLSVRSSKVKLDALEVLVLDDASLLLEAAGRDTVISLLQSGGEGSIQVAIIADPVTPGIRKFVDRHVRRAVFFPPEASGGTQGGSPVQRGSLRVHTVEREAIDVVARLVGQLLAAEVDHVLAFARSEDAAADLGDALTLRGFLAGAPGDTEAPIWLGLDPLEARKLRDALDSEKVAVVSVDVPTDADELDRRHGGWKGPAIALARPREIAHLRRAAAEAGYALDFTADSAPREPANVSAFLARVEDALDRADLGAYTILLEPLVCEHGAVPVAAALASLLRGKAAMRAGPAADGLSPGEPAVPVGDRPPAWVKLFMSVGKRDNVGAGDLLGAITGETGIAGDQVGRIDVRDTFSRVDVQDSVAQSVMEQLNGTSIRGRSVRVDFDRGEGRPSGSGRGGDRRPSGGKRGPTGGKRDRS